MNRTTMLQYLLTLAEPLLTAAANDRLRDVMTVEEKTGANRSPYTYWEAVGRLICGMGPWLVSESGNAWEAKEKERYAVLCREAIRNQVTPSARDYTDFPHLCHDYSQIVVDTAFLMEGIFRGKAALLDAMEDEIRNCLLAVLHSARAITPYRSNWYLFSAFVEAGIYLLTGEFDKYRVEMIFDQLDQWYIGDGFYTDGSRFAMDYYNSYVIHPMLCDLAMIFDGVWLHRVKPALYLERLSRYAAIQERQIAPDGTFIAIGRSIAYRCGAFHALALAAYRHLLPEGLPPSQVRCALSAVIARTLDPDSFDANGFLKIGLCGTQPSLGEGYISTGSLYLCSTAFLPLGLSPDDPFWTGEDLPWTQKRLWLGEDLPADHASF